MPDTWKHFAEQHPDRIISDSGAPDSVPGTESDSAPRASPERDMQQALIDLCAAREAEYPCLEWIYATPNGQYRPGQRMEPGLKSGVPDVFLPAPAGGYHGLYLELKSATGRVRNAQRRWLRGLRAQGYAARVARSLAEADDTITAYLEDTLDPLPEDDSD
jgi:hypothetical protein